MEGPVDALPKEEDSSKEEAAQVSSNTPVFGLVSALRCPVLTLCCQDAPEAVNGSMNGTDEAPSPAKTVESPAQVTLESRHLL